MNSILKNLRWKIEQQFRRGGIVRAPRRRRTEEA
jgi:hypothetical protein